ncbi:MAG: hypothetical protein ACHQ7N_03890 [Candidatus Methylomirabilales bacterium]
MTRFDETANDRSRMQMNSRWAAAGCPWLWLLVLLAVGCSRAPTVVPTQPIEAQQFKGKRGGISVGVDPYFTADRVVQTFRGGDNFAGSGVLPIQVTIENGSGGEISVDPRDFRLAHTNSPVDMPISADSAYSLVKIRVQYWALLPIVGTAVTAGRNEPILKDLEAREMREGKIPPGGTTTGFVYFQVAEPLKDLAGTVMVVVAKGPSGQDLIFEIPLQGRRDLPAATMPAEASAPTAPPKPAPLDPKNPKGPTRIEGTGGGVIIRSPAQ